MSPHCKCTWINVAGRALLGAMLANAVVAAARRDECENRMHNCTEKVRPFLHDLEYMFPTNIQHVDSMCRMWSGFVECIRLYVKDCATEEQRSRFNDAVGDSIDTVHAICSSDKHQKEYLQSASCFRKVSVDNCGAHYNDMVDEVSVSGGTSDNICCSYSKFQSCVSEPLLRLCGSRARNIMDHSMAFLVHRCSGTSYSLSFECPRSRGRSAFSDDRPIVVSSSSVSNLATSTGLTGRNGAGGGGYDSASRRNGVLREGEVPSAAARAINSEFDGDRTRSSGSGGLYQPYQHRHLPDDANDYRRMPQLRVPSSGLTPSEANGPYGPRDPYQYRAIVPHQYRAADVSSSSSSSSSSSQSRFGSYPSSVGARADFGDSTARDRDATGQGTTAREHQRPPAVAAAAAAGLPSGAPSSRLLRNHFNDLNDPSTSRAAPRLRRSLLDGLVASLLTAGAVMFVVL